MLYSWDIIKESADWQIAYDSNNKHYRASYFEAGHFVDDIIFREPQKESGEWIEDYEVFTDDGGSLSSPIQTGYVCSECNKDGNVAWPFCPYCGISMHNAIKC